MANKFKVEIEAVDKFTAVGKRINASIQNVLKPLEKFTKRAGLGEASGGIGKLSAAVDELGISGSFAGGMVAGFGGAALLAAGSIGRLALKTAEFGVRVDLAAANIGISTSRLQSLRLAQELVGGSADALQGDLQNLGVSFEDAFGGRNQPLLALINQLGIRIKRTKDGVVDVNAAFLDTADAINKIKSPEVQMKVAQMFGLEGSLPLIRQQRAGIAALTAEMQKYGAVQDPAQEAKSKALYQSWERLGFAAQGAGNRISSFFSPALTALFDSLSNSAAAVEKSSFLQRLLTGIAGATIPGVQMAIGAVDTYNAATNAYKAPTSPSAPSAAPPPFRNVHGNVGGGTKPAPKLLPAISALGKKAAALGIRNYNPGNLRSWGGVPTIGGYAQFGSLDAGTSALAQQLLLYQTRDHLNSISGIIRKYAPNNENDTQSYIADVMQRMGRGANDALNLSDPDTLSSLMKSIIAHENSNYSLPSGIIEKAVRDRLAAEGSVPSIYGRPGAAAGPSPPPQAPSVVNHLDVTVHNATPGTRVTVTKPDDVTGGTRITYGMPGVNL